MGAIAKGSKKLLDKLDANHIVQITKTASSTFSSILDFSKECLRTEKVFKECKAKIHCSNNELEVKLAELKSIEHQATLDHELNMCKEENAHKVEMKKLEILPFEEEIRLKERDYGFLNPEVQKLKEQLRQQKLALLVRQN